MMIATDFVAEFVRIARMPPTKEAADYRLGQGTGKVKRRQNRRRLCATRAVSCVRATAERLVTR
jgi:hypothetical protein